MAKPKVCSLPQIIQALSDPKTEVAVDLVGHAMFFEKRQDWHTAWAAGLRQHVLYFCRAGQFQAKVKEETVAVRSGELIWIQPETAFEFQLCPGTKSTKLARFRLGLACNGRILRMAPDFLLMKPAPLVRTWLDQIHYYNSAKGPWQMVALRAALAGFLAAAGEGDSSSGAGERRLNNNQLARLEYFVDVRGVLHCEPKDLAAHLGLAPAYFNRLFRAATGRSARTWLVEKRVQMAAQHLVESTRRVGEVADAFGYENVYFFSRQFRAVMGASPREYRQRHSAGR